jgi:hypothetical protein
MRIGYKVNQPEGYTAALSEVYAYKSSILMSHKLGLPWTQWSYDLMMQYYGSFTK